MVGEISARKFWGENFDPKILTPKIANRKFRLEIVSEKFRFGLGLSR